MRSSAGGKEGEAGRGAPARCAAVGGVVGVAGAGLGVGVLRGDEEGLRTRAGGVAVAGDARSAMAAPDGAEGGRTASPGAFDAGGGVAAAAATPVEGAGAVTTGTASGDAVTPATEAPARRRRGPSKRTTTPATTTMDTASPATAAARDALHAPAPGARQLGTAGADDAGETSWGRRLETTGPPVVAAPRRGEP